MTLAAVVLAMVLAESLMLTDFFMPGEVGLVAAGAAAAHNDTSAALIVVAATVGAIAGDSAGYGVGRGVGTSVIEQRRWARRLRPGLHRAERYFSRRGGVAVAAARWVGALRAVVPVVAGTSKMPVVRFLVWDIPSAAAWCTALVSVGFVWGDDIADVIDRIGLGISGVVVGVLVVVALVVWRRRRSSHSAHGEDCGHGVPGTGSGGGTMNEEVEHRLHALDAIRSWPEESRKPASWLIYVHQEPDHVSETELVWERVEPWMRIVATREFETREWPFLHTASVHSTARYHVPPDREAEIRELDFAVDVDAEQGTVEAVGPDLATNLLMVNLVHDVATGDKTPMEAHCRYTDLTTRPHDGPPPGDMTKCRFADLETTEPAANPASGESLESSPSVPKGGPTAMSSEPTGEPEDPETELDTDHVNDRRRTRERGDDVDEAAQRSSGFDLDDEVEARDDG